MSVAVEELMALRSTLGHGPAEFVWIVGAPRCGTTTLAGFLKDHPDVCFSYMKEPHYFSRHDLTGLADDELHRRLEADYLPRFFPHRSGERVLAEGSVSYLYAPQPLSVVLRCWPASKFIVALRDPLEMIPSLHQRLLVTGDETERDLQRAWGLMEERARGRRIPPSCMDPRLLQYREAGCFGSYVADLFHAVGPERCFLAVFDDLTADPAAIYEEMLAFLGLPFHPRSDFAARRTSRGYKVGWLQRLLKRPPVAARLLASDRFLQRTRPLNGGGRPGLQAVARLRKALLKWNEARPTKPELAPELRTAICAALAEEIADLSELIGRDLGHWLDGAPAQVARERREAAAREYALARPAQGLRSAG